jgi:predicted alpha/beta hydrolase family esterase
VELFLNAAGYETSARHWMEPGDDITARRGMLELSIEAKDHRALALASWVDQAERNAPEGAIAVVVAHRLGKAGVAEAYVILSGRSFADLLESL